MHPNIVIRNTRIIVKAYPALIGISCLGKATNEAIWSFKIFRKLKTQIK